MVRELAAAREAEKVTGRLRIYAGAAVSPRRGVDGTEVKFASATLTGAQPAFDAGVDTPNTGIRVEQSAIIPDPLERGILIAVR